MRSYASSRFVEKGEGGHTIDFTNFSCQAGTILTIRKDRLPKEIAGKYLHKQATGTKHKTKVARFLQPVFCVKKHKGDPNNLISITSFQSTGSCNIASVNANNTTHVIQNVMLPNILV